MHPLKFIGLANVVDLSRDPLFLQSARASLACVAFIQNIPRSAALTLKRYQRWW